MHWIVGGTVAIGASSFIKADTPAGTAAGFALGAAAQYAWETRGEMLGGALGGYTSDPGPVHPAVQTGYQWLNNATNLKGVGDLMTSSVKALEKKAQDVAQSVLKKAMEQTRTRL